MSHDFGSRFDRELTQAEMDVILSTLKNRGAAAAFMEMWDIVLMEAEGCTWREADEQGRRFCVTDYAIPSAQQDRLRDAMLFRRARSARMKIIWTWFQLGPAASDPGAT